MVEDGMEEDGGGRREGREERREGGRRGERIEDGKSG